MASKAEKKESQKSKAAAEVEGGHQKNPISEDGDSKHTKKEKEEGKEGRFLLGLPTFLDMGNGRWRCVESGHEMVAKDKDSYARSKACRLALIDAALAAKKPPLNTFQPHPAAKYSNNAPNPNIFFRFFFFLFLFCLGGVGWWVVGVLSLFL